MQRTTWRRIIAIYLTIALFVSGVVFINPIQAYSSEGTEEGYEEVEDLDDDDDDLDEIFEDDDDENSIEDDGDERDEDEEDNDEDQDENSSERDDGDEDSKDDDDNEDDDLGGFHPHEDDEDDDDDDDLDLDDEDDDEDKEDEDADDEDENDEDESFALGASGMAMAPMAAQLSPGVYSVTTFKELKDLLHDDKKIGSAYIYLDADITMEYWLYIYATDVTIDGRGMYTIEQPKKTHYSFKHKTANSTFTFKDVDIIGRSNDGFVFANAKNSTTIFDNVTYRGPQLFSGKNTTNGKDSTVYVRNCTFTSVCHDKNTVDPAEMFYYVNNLIFDEGTTVINHEPTKTTNSAINVYGAGGGITVTNGADVTINSTSYLMKMSSSKYASITVEDGATLDINAAGMHYSTHLFDTVRVGEDSTLTYTQRGDTNSVSYYAALSTDKLVLEPGSTFIYDVQPTKTIGSTEKSTNGTGLRVASTVNITAPQYVSIYSYAPTGKVASGLRKDGAANWYVNDVDYVHYWTTSAANASIANPANDSDEYFRPEYTWTTRDAGTTFSFSGSAKNGVTVGPDLPNVAVNSSGTILTGSLKDTLTFNEKTQRIVIGVPEGVWVIPEVLTFAYVPTEFNFGEENEIPVITTLYNRQDVDMNIQIIDTRKNGDPWKLTVAVSPFIDESKNQTLDTSTLVFIDDGEKVPLAATPTVIFEPDPNALEGEYDLTWGQDEGLLVEVGPGMAKEGNYVSKVTWSLEVTPDTP